MITIHFEDYLGVQGATTVHREDKLWACKQLLDEGYYLIGESIPEQTS